MNETKENNLSMQTTTINNRQNPDKLLHKRKKFLKRRFPIGISIGICLTLFTIILQCIALFTPHWKEISPKTHSLYVDGVDALIRTEVLHYYNNVHRFTRHSYGLFQRCEYDLSNSSSLPDDFVQHGTIYFSTS